MLTRRKLLKHIGTGVALSATPVSFALADGTNQVCQHGVSWHIAGGLSDTDKAEIFSRAQSGLRHFAQECLPTGAWFDLVFTDHLDYGQRLQMAFLETHNSAGEEFLKDWWSRRDLNFEGTGCYLVGRLQVRPMFRNSGVAPCP